MLVTNQPQMVEAARVSYRDYPTAVNAIGQSNKTYRNEMSEYAKMDTIAQHAQLGIGLSSNCAQLCLSYLWTKKARGEDDEEAQELYHDCIILATIAQILIDGIKRSFEVDGVAEIERIRQTPVMMRTRKEIVNGKEVVIKNDFPKFMKYVREVPLTKNGNELEFSEVKKAREKIIRRIDEKLICPMNWLQKHLDKIQGIPKTIIGIPTKDFFIYMKGLAVDYHVGKVRKIVEEYDHWIKLNINKINEQEDGLENQVLEKSKKVYDEIRGIKLSQVTINHLISSCVGFDDGNRTPKNKRYIDAQKYARKILNCLYKSDKNKFLKCFKSQSICVD